MIRDPDSPLSFDPAAAFGRHQPGRGRGGRVMHTEELELLPSEMDVAPEFDGNDELDDDTFY